MEKEVPVEVARTMLAALAKRSSPPGGKPCPVAPERSIWVRCNVTPPKAVKLLLPFDWV